MNGAIAATAAVILKCGKTTGSKWKCYERCDKRDKRNATQRSVSKVNFIVRVFKCNHQFVILLTVSIRVLSLL